MKPAITVPGHRALRHRSLALSFSRRSGSYRWCSIGQVVVESLIMAGRAQIRTNSSALIAMIADEDTVTGFLLAGVGNVDLRRKTNYLIVDSKTTVKTIEDAFKEFTSREDIAVVLISQYIANMIRFLVDSYNKPVPAILEIPSKDHPYDPAHDSVLSRVKYLFSSESVASGRR
ncbi:V-type proton ATPase subunit F [Canna indica]|uniref:V-type proton ATPase subunit F n=1 Tax=Canna indica TaxID=4628 RepID=A0AAQ3Q717_9LILI|nr:V-type proton ATPase subunit F [Canna indica]